MEMRPIAKTSLQFAAALLLCCGTLSSSGQIGGEDAFTFLKLPPSARLTALGGSLITVRDEDPAMAVLNPATLTEATSGGMTFQNNFHFDGIYNGYVGYAHHIENWGITSHGGVQFMQYGDFTLADEFGNALGEFKASEMAITIGASRAFSERLSAGVNLRFINANYESYHSSALAADIGGTYFNEESQFSAGVVIRNVGVQLSAFEEVNENLPLDIQVGISKRLKHLPFRFSVTAHSLNRWNLRYESPLDDDGTTILGDGSNETSQFSKEVDNFFRHMIFSGEFLIGKTEVLKLRIGYNHQRRKELTVGSLRSLAGFSAGVGIRIKQFSIDYGFGSYHIAGSTQHIGISTHLDRFKKSTIVD